MGKHRGISPIITLQQSAPAPYLLVALDTGFDAGEVTRLTAGHLLSSLEPEEAALLDIDNFYDYRARRPRVTYSQGRLVDYDYPELRLLRLHDDGGQPFFVLTGMEPDLGWIQISDAILDLIEELHIAVTLLCGSIPGNAPHTRPTSVLVRQTLPALLDTDELDIGFLQGPSSFSAFLEARLIEQKRAAVGITAYVPHYVGQAPYPAAASALINFIARISGLALPVGELEAAAAQTRSDIDAQLRESPEAQELVATVEKQFDAMVAATGMGTQLPLSPQIPSADELGRALENFLAEQEQAKRRHDENN